MNPTDSYQKIRPPFGRRPAHGSITMKSHFLWCPSQRLVSKGG